MTDLQTPEAEAREAYLVMRATIVTTQVHSPHGLLFKIHSNQHDADRLPHTWLYAVFRSGVLYTMREDGGRDGEQERLREFAKYAHASETIPHAAERALRLLQSVILMEESRLTRLLVARE